MATSIDVKNMSLIIVRHIYYVNTLHNFSVIMPLMDTTPDQIRMTLRLPKDLRDAIEKAVEQGSSASVTAEIINRLRKSFELNPLSNDNPNDLIKQCAATILDTLDKLDKKPTKQSVQNPKANHSVTDDERRLLDEFNALPKGKRKSAVNLFLAVMMLVKS